MSVAGMYWSRKLGPIGFSNWADDPSVEENFNTTEVYYFVSDHIISTKTTMDTSWLLYLILAIQLGLTLTAYVASRMFYPPPIDANISLISILAGARQESLTLFRGASLSGRVAKPVRMQDDPVAANATRVGVYRTRTTLLRHGHDTGYRLWARGFSEGLSTTKYEV